MSIADYDAERGIGGDADSGLDVGDDDGPEVTKVELIDLTQKESDWGGRAIITPTSALHQSRDTSGEYGEYALILRRRVDRDGNSLAPAQLEVRSPVIRQVLQDVLKDYPHINLFACPVVFRKPYGEIFHYRTELREYAAAPERTVEEKKHMAPLLDFMDKDLGPVEKAWQRLVPKGLISFPYLWTIFRPDELIVYQDEEFKECYRVRQCEQKTKDGTPYFEIDCWSWAYNGSKFGPSRAILCIDSFPGDQKINKMEICPFFLLDSEAQKTMELDLVSRGRKWRELVDNSHRSYNGPGWTDRLTNSAESMNDLVPKHISGRIILDYNTHRQANWRLGTQLIGAAAADERSEARRRFQGLGGLFDSSDESLPRVTRVDSAFDKSKLKDIECYPNNSKYHMTDEQALLSPARIRGFSLAEKIWCFFLVEKIKPIRWSETAFEKLSLAEQMKDTIRALVETHKDMTAEFDDLIVGKGKGLIFLLYGPPGSGKTLTAESIAEYTHKPLYIIGSGELGTDVEATDKHLRQIFQRAKSWDSILLLDEADVFLTKRSQDDLFRNAFVSIFLRLLEYYEGILFLTTNRAREFDPAFQSRIHLTVQYKALDAQQRGQIWRNLLEAGPSKKSWEPAVIEQLGHEFQLNGREIKNLYRTARAISRHQKKDLTDEMLRMVYQFNLKAQEGKQESPFGNEKAES